MRISLAVAVFAALSCSDGTGPGTVVPEKPQYLSPLNGADDVPVNIELEWSEAKGADWYIVLVGSRPDQMDSVETRETSLALLDLPHGTTIPWQVGAVAPDTTVWGDMWSFTTVPALMPPAAPVYVSPTAGTVVLTNTTFKWFTTNGAELYRVCRGTAEDNLSVCGTTQDTTLSVVGLAFSTPHYWQVTAVNDAGETEGPVWMFVTASPSADNLVHTELSITDGSGAEVQSSTVDGTHTFKASFWGDADNALRYAIFTAAWPECVEGQNPCVSIAFVVDDYLGRAYAAGERIDFELEAEFGSVGNWLVSTLAVGEGVAEDARRFVVTAPAGASGGFIVNGQVAVKVDGSLIGYIDPVTKRFHNKR